MSTRIEVVGDGTKIEWADETFNPWIGCARVSPGCQHCYAEQMARRYGWAEWGVNGDRHRTSPANWRKPLTWNRKAEAAGVRPRVFCASLADVFEDRHDLKGWRADLCLLIEATPHLDWLLLTKRPENVLRLAPAPWVHGYSLSAIEGQPALKGIPQWPANVWIGTTVEDQQRADERIPHLLAVPAPVRFLSVEPMLGPVDLDRPGWLRRAGKIAAGPIDWVIAGGESGPGARPTAPEDFRRLRDQCEEAGVPFLFKQWGDWLPHEYGPPPFWMPADGGPWVDGHELPADLSEGEPTGGWWAPDISEDAIYHRVGKKNAGRMLDGRTHDATPEGLR